MTEKLRARRWKTGLSIFTIVALVVLAYTVREQLSQTVSNLARVSVSVLILMIPLQIGNYFFQGKLYQSLFRILGDRFRTRSMVRLAWELAFVNTIFPSGGVSGFSYITVRLRDEKISTGKATFVQMMRFVLIFIGFQVLLFVGLLILAIGGQANDVAILVASSVSTLLLAGTFLLVYVIGSKERINSFFTVVTRGINRLIHVFRPKHPETINIMSAKKAFTELHENYMQIKSNLRALGKPLMFAFSGTTCEILTIYIVYLAFSEWVNPGAVIIAYAIANFAGLISILPGGIGVYEALMTAVLTAGGIPAAISLPVTVMYRVLNMLIQLIPGYWFYHRALHSEPIYLENEQ